MSEKTENLLIQIFKFLIVGGIAFLIDYFTLFCCKEFINLSVLLSTAIAFTISVIYNYIASIKWVFNVNNENVTMDLLNYYLDIKGKNPAKDVLVKRRVAGMCERQIRIWLSMDVSEETKDDLNKFLKTVKSKSDEIYKSIPGKKALLLRIFGIKAYKLTSKIQHKSDSKG